MLGFLVRHGGVVAAVLGLAPPALAVAALAAGWAAGWLAVGLAAGVVLFALVKSYVELIRVVTDMLLPK